MRVLVKSLVYSILVGSLVVVACGDAIAATPAALERKALAAMERGDYEAAAGTFRSLLDRVPNSPRPLFNLACCCSRLGQVDNAAGALQGAWEAGFRNLELIQSDPDLHTLRSSSAGKRMLARFEKQYNREKRLRGDALVFDAEVLGSARIVTPAVLDPERLYPLVVALHGNGGSSEGFAGIFVAAGLSPDLIVVAPQAPYATSNINGFGYSWFPSVDLFDELTKHDGVGDQSVLMKRRHDLEQRELEVSAHYVLAAIDTVVRDLPVDPERVYVLGFSQGGVIAYDLALRHPTRFAGLIAIGTFLRDEITSPDALAAAKNKIRALVCHSAQDEAVAIDEGKAAFRRLKAAGIDSRFVRYEGGHSLSAELLATIARWIEGAPVDQAPLPNLQP